MKWMKTYQYLLSGSLHLMIAKIGESINLNGGMLSGGGMKEESGGEGGEGFTAGRLM